MAKHVLYSPEVGAAFNEVGSEGMAEGVRTNIFFNACKLGTFFYNHKNHDSAQLLAPAIEEKKIAVLGINIRHSAAYALDIQTDMFYRLFSYGYNALFITLSQNFYVANVQG